MNLLRHLGFMFLGVLAFYDPQDPLNIAVIAFGCILGISYSILYKGFIHRALRLLNGKVKKEHGKEPMARAVALGGLFILPFALLAGLSTLWFGWQLNTSFVTTGVTAIGTAAGLEFSKLTGKPRLKNTLTTASLSWVFSTLWTFGIPYLVHAPGFIEGGISLVRSLIAGN